MTTLLWRRPGWRIGLALVLTLLTVALLVPGARGAGPGGREAHVFTTDNRSGRAQTISVGPFPVVDPDNPFFLELGINGRRCVTCHQPSDNMTVTPSSLRQRFNATGGTDPIFRTNDGSNSPLADVSTLRARRAAYSMLLTKGLIRVGLPVPAGAEFELVQVDDPYGYAGHNANGNELSLFRRPLPATNLRFLSTVMWDGRETLRKGSAGAIHFDLANQANDATMGHAQAPAAVGRATLARIVAYERGLFTAQVFDRRAGNLEADGARGGPQALSRRAFVFGVNDPLGCNRTGDACDPARARFDPIVFTEFDAWAGLPAGGRNAARAALARGQALFNARPIAIRNVSGINDDFHVDTVIGSCTTCHDTPHAGDHSVPAPLDIGIADPPVSVAEGGDGVHNAFGLRVGDMPVYTLRNTATGETKTLTDPGRALITGKWKDLGRFKGPILRGLAGRAPYFHNGSAATLADVVEFYDVRFALGLSAREKADLVAFLEAL
jgi:hypothetical protein